MKDIIILDTETGGLDPKVNGLLSLSAKLNNQDEIITLYLKPQDNLVYEEKALNVNQLNLEQLKRDGLDKRVFCKTFYIWLLEIGAKYNIEQYRIVGHNIHFDINFLKETFKEYKQYSPFRYKGLFDYHYIDTCVIANYLIDSNKIDPQNIKLITLYKHLKNIAYDELTENAHNSHIDVLMTEYIYNKFIEVLK